MAIMTKQLLEHKADCDEVFWLRIGSVCLMNEGIRITVSVNDRNRLQGSGFKCESIW